MAQHVKVIVGGRIKAASVGVSHLYPADDLAALDDRLRLLRRTPPEGITLAFFPLTGGRLRHMVEGVGFYRPTLKTDQGMPGNFLGFRIIGGAVPAAAPYQVVAEEGIALLEHWLECSADLTQKVQRSFLDLNLGLTYGGLAEGGLLEVRREAGRGRAAFFFCRPARTDRPIVVGQPTASDVEAVVSNFLAEAADRAGARAGKLGMKFSANLIYCQADVFLGSDGSAVIERVNLPDVGMFLADLGEYPGAMILPEIAAINIELRSQICGRIREVFGPAVAIVTRDEILRKQEDLLELREIASIERGLREAGVTSIRVVDTSRLGELPDGTAALLLNINYADEAATRQVLEASRRLQLYPHPLMQMELQRATGLVAGSIPERYREEFLELAGSIPKPVGIAHVLGRINRRLTDAGITGDILHCTAGGEIIPVFRWSMHSWRHLAERVRGKEERLIIRSLPLSVSSPLLTGETGPRLHAFRFTGLISE